VTRRKALTGLALLLAVAGPGMATAANAPALELGTRLPELKGDDLGGRKVVLPGAAAGKVTFLALGFSYASRFQVEDWTAAFRKAYGQDPRLTFYEVPMIGGMARMGGFFINRGMRKGTPAELHGHVVTVYGGTGPWRERLGYADAKSAYLVLLDAGGIVRWRHAGPHSPEAMVELVRAIEALLAAAAGPQGPSATELTARTW